MQLIPISIPTSRNINININVTVSGKWEPAIYLMYLLNDDDDGMGILVYGMGWDEMKEERAW